jgi:hypothetical protein
MKPGTRDGVTELKSEWPRIDLNVWVLQTPFGPMVHRDTGESYQAYGARLEHEAHQRMKGVA